jgi:hypothetical protein
MHIMVYETLQIAVVLGFMAFLAWLWFRRSQQQTELHRLHLEGRNRLLEQIGTPQALMEFVTTEAGHALLDPLVHFKDSVPRPRRDGLWLIQAGLVTLLVGVGFRSTYYLAMNWGAANIQLKGMDAMDAFRKALSLWQWSQTCEWAGIALITCGLLSALLAYLERARASRN